MLSIGAMAGGQGAYYVHLAREDYYLDGGEPPGKWIGAGAEKLSLQGTVDGDQLRHLFRGFSADGQRGLIKNAGSDRHQPGWDLTFSAPKSVSVLWSQADAQARKAIQEAHAAAVKEALTYLEETATFTRRGKAGQTWEPAGLVTATFEHGTSRALDPQLHTHCLVLNIGTRMDDTTGSLLSKPLYQHKMAAGALYRAELAFQLANRLGVRCELDGTSFHVQGVPQPLCEHYSKRRAEVQAELGRMGLESAEAAAFATLGTRKAKQVVPPRQELFSIWRGDGVDQGFDAAAVLGRSPKIANPAKELPRLISRALNEMTRDESSFTAKDLTKVVAQAAQSKALSAGDIRASVQHALQHSRHIVKLGAAGQEQYYTTRRTIKLEKALIRTAEKLRADQNHGLAKSTVDKHLARYTAPRSALAAEFRHHVKQIVKTARKQETTPVDRNKLRKQAELIFSDEQREAIRHLTQWGNGGIRFLEGLAGTSKTTILNVARELWEKDGYRVVGVAVGGKAAKGLANGAGIESYTFAMLNKMMNPAPRLKDQAKHHLHQLGRAALGKHTFRLDPFRLNDRTVVVVDEASMLSTYQWATLAKAVEERGGMLVAVGDRKQLPAIQAGGAFGYLADLFGKAELKTIVRQKDQRDVQAVKDMADGRAEEAIKNLAERGLVTVANTREEAVRSLVSDWAKNEKGRRDKNLIFVGTNEATHDINIHCQKERLRSKELDAGKRVSVTTTIGRETVRFELYRGDRVLFTKRSRTLGVENGETGTVIGIKRGSICLAAKSAFSRPKTPICATGVALSGPSAVGQPHSWSRKRSCEGSETAKQIPFPLGCLRRSVFHLQLRLRPPISRARNRPAAGNSKALDQGHARQVALEPDHDCRSLCAGWGRRLEPLRKRAVPAHVLACLPTSVFCQNARGSLALVCCLSSCSSFWSEAAPTARAYAGLTTIGLRMFTTTVIRTSPPAGRSGCPGGNCGGHTRNA